jgi:protoheme IX farnesyltransferase
MLPSIAPLPTVTRQILGYVVVLWVASLLLAPAAHLNLGYAGAALVLGGLFFGYAWALLRDPSPRRAMKLFGFSITYLTALFIAMGADAVIRIH